MVLDYYLELIRKIHIRTYAYLGEMRASTNPLAYCEGGFYSGHLGLHDKIKPLLKTATASFGITAFNELQRLYNGKSLVEDGAFAIEVLKHINCLLYTSTSNNTTNAAGQSQVSAEAKAAADAIAKPTISAEAGILYDVTNGRVLFEKNADEKLAPASTTKLMTRCV